MPTPTHLSASKACDRSTSNRRCRGKWEVQPFSAGYIWFTMELLAPLVPPWETEAKLWGMLCPDLKVVSTGGLALTISPHRKLFPRRASRKGPQYLWWPCLSLFSVASVVFQEAYEEVSPHKHLTRLPSFSTSQNFEEIFILGAFFVAKNGELT